MKIDGLTFTEAVERLADKYGVQLRREERRRSAPSGREGPQRGRLIEAHKVAQEFYAEQLGDPDAARRPGSSCTSAASTRTPPSTFGIGFAPRDGEALLRHLRQTRLHRRGAGRGRAGRPGPVGLYDRFRGRLLWPIRDASGDAIGFGARRIFDDDRIEAKYLNTSETPIYKKSQVLYGIDLARREIARVVAGRRRRGLHRRDGLPPRRRGHRGRDLRHRLRRRARPGAAPVPARPRGVPRRGDLHLRRRRRRAEGRAAGLRAATRTSSSQTYVAVEPDGLDPCDLRHPEGRRRRARAGRRAGCRSTASCSATSSASTTSTAPTAGSTPLREAARLVSSIRDQSKVDAFAREIAGMVGVDIDEARDRGAPRRHRPAPAPPAAAADPRRPAPRGAAPSPPRRQLPDLRDPRFSLERETLKLVIQHPVGHRPHHRRRRRQRLHPPDLPRGLGAGGRAPAARRRGGRPGLGVAAARRRPTDPAVSSAISALGVEPVLHAASRTPRTSPRTSTGSRSSPRCGASPR